MSKNKPPKKRKKINTDVEKPKTTLKISQIQQNFLFCGIIAIILIFLLKPIVIDGLSPQGVDVVGAIGTSHQVTQWEKQSGERALWNPNVFSGMPRYQRTSPAAFSFDTILNWFAGFFSSVLVYYLFGGIGVFLFLRYLGMTAPISFFAAMAFVLMPHYKSLFLEGHMAKFRALMILPWIIFSFKYFLDRRTITGIALFTLFFGMQIRTQHYQIVFYTGLFVFAIGIYPVIKDLIDKAYKQFFKTSLLIIVAVVLAILTASQPLFLAKEYLPWSKRGKTTIDINAPEKTQNVGKSDGVSIDYATGWSTAPSEILTWIVPHYFGGMSREKYSGSAIPQLKGREIPGYWGEMPFTQSYEYMGAITFLLALIGFVFYRKNQMILAISIFMVFLILLSFGRHAQWFYSIFFDYVPFFNKFRAPMMSVTITFFIIALFAAFGLNALKSKIDQVLDFKKNKSLLLIIGGFIGFGLIIWLAGQGLSFLKAGENYDAQTTTLLQTIRKEMLNNDMLRFMALIVAASVTIILYLKKKVTFAVLLLFLMAISLIDLINIQGHVEKTFIDKTKLENNYFRKTPTDNAILQDKDLYRIYPMGDNFGSNRFSYYHQSIGGYTPIKMYTIEEFVTNNLSGGTVANRNIMKILNVKYLVSSQSFNSPDLTAINYDEGQKLVTYKYNHYKERGYFVGSYIKIEDEYKRLETINSQTFDPDSTAILEEDLPGEINLPDSSSVIVTRHNPNQTHFEIYTNKKSLFVISEIYYPPGWKILMDGQPVKKIYKTNHAVQSIVVPAGKHKIEVNFSPDSYKTNIHYAVGSVSLLFLVLLSSVITQFLKSREKNKN